MSESVKVTVKPPCDIDAAHGPAYADAKTRMGPWAYLCMDCFRQFSLGRLGTGYGQRLVLEGES